MPSRSGSTGQAGARPIGWLGHAAVRWAMREGWASWASWVSAQQARENSFFSIFKSFQDLQTKYDSNSKFE
jgi:hypothetical protein